jgi:putative transposase
MRYPASEKLEIIRIVEQAHLPVKKTLDKLGIPRPTFYRWYDRFLTHGVERLEDRHSAPSRVWNRTPDDIRNRIIDMALDQTELSPRELAVRFTDTESYFVSEASVYRLLKVHDLITSPAFIVIKAGDEFKDKTTRPNQLWQTDFTYLKVIGWGWFYLSTVLDDFSRYIVAWKLCTTMKVEDVTGTLNLALTASGCDTVRLAQTASAIGQWPVLHRFGPGRVARKALRRTAPRRTGPSANPGQDRALASTLKSRILLENYFFSEDLEAQIAAFVEHYNHRRYHESIGNLTPADVYFGRGHTILLERERIKRHTIKLRRLQHRQQAA